MTRLEGALVDQTRPLNFTFNGKPMQGYHGDTLASALLANGQKLVARSFKYHRPRGVFSAGSEEPNALVTLHDGAATTPNTRATVVPLVDGLQVRSQNHMGSLENDLLAANDRLASFFGAGFYYKTFMWPAGLWERLYEPIIRRAAGLGRLSDQGDPEEYGRVHAHCDLLVIGAGPAGLMAALTAGRAGARVILADEDFQMGGRLNAERLRVGDDSGQDWAASVAAELTSLPNVRLLTRTTVWGTYDHGIYAALQQAPFTRPEAGKIGSVQWRITARHSILAAGATERPIAFGNNDRPGVMLAGSVRAYVNRWGVAPGDTVTVFTNNDDGWKTAHDLTAAGVTVAAIIDSRTDTQMTAPDGVEAILGTAVIDTKGHRALRQITLGSGRKIDTDCLAVSGGWNPNVHLSCHHRARPTWCEELASFVPGKNLPQGMTVAGVAQGSFELGAALAEGANRAAIVLDALGRPHQTPDIPRTFDTPYRIHALWQAGAGRAWVDLQNDVGTKDITLAHREGYQSVEHLKRYTTLGMATDQGRTANVLGLALMAEARGQSIEETGTTMFRPPYTPVPIGALAGGDRGMAFRPTRRTPAHDWAEAQGAVFVESGAWLRAQWFPRDGETHWRQSVDREVTATRASVGICDVSTLGKIDLKGRDVATFLNRVYANKFAKLAVGKTRYGLMLREDGVVMDDGTTARLGEHHYVMTTTTANAGPVFQHLEFCLQCLWPDLDVHLQSTTDAWAQFAVAGPRSRALLEKLVDAPFDVSNQGFPFMACGNLTICGGTPARLFRVSFSGELAYELAVPARFGNALAERLMADGKEFDVTPYGTEALNVMRIEKGHAAGNELDGRNAAINLNMAGMTGKEVDFIGRTLQARTEMQGDELPRMVGLRAIDTQAELSAGAHLIDLGDRPTTQNDQGWVSSAAWSPTLGCPIALGFLRGGHKRLGERLRAWDGVRGRDCEVEVVSPHFHDPEGGLQRG
ncbi:sarcosine oxidase subunit alpha family protein [Microbulbifer sp. S227A]|uniref:sarcosine oxidase subunit alpha family protein n=1 Tax=Microbulbifer sp. S227A TaxID=3415131 RepID=UPI003C7ACB14